MPDEPRSPDRRPLVTHGHRKRSVVTWLVPLAIVIAIMVLLPKLIGLLEKQ